MTAYGRYELIERIGQGTLTDVFKAKRYGVEGFEKVLVVKRLREQLALDAERVRGFIQCAQQALRLSHSNVVHVLDLGEVEGETKSYFLATELVTGARLRDVLELRRGVGEPLTLEMALYIAAEVCRALDHAHRRQDSSGVALGIVHGQLNPENIFLSDEGEVKVSDFCTAALGAGSDASTSIAGDLNRLGMLLFELLRLTPPPRIAPDSTFVGFGLPVDDLLGRLLMGDPDLEAADVHEQLLMYAYACRDWVGADHVAELVLDWRKATPEARADSFPPELPNTQSSQPPPIAVPEADRSTSLGDFRSFVGRTQETNRVGRRLAIVAHRKLQAVGIVGPAGIGKSRFVTELRRRLERGGLNLAFYIVRCPLGGRQQPLSGVVAMLRVLFGLVGAESVDRDALVIALRTLGLSGARADAVLSELGATPVSEAAAPPLRAAVERVFASLADDRMHVFAWDDVCDLDEWSAELLVAAAEELAQKRIAFIFAGRQLPSQRLSSIQDFEEVVLGPLNAAALKRLTQVRLGVSEVPDALQEFVSTKTRGNPWFVEELLREAITSGALDTEGAGLTIHDLRRISIAERLATQLANRVRRLDERQLEVLRLVARLGEWAHIARVMAALSLSQGETEELFQGLQQQGFMLFDEQRARLPSRLVLEALAVDATPDQMAAWELQAGETLLLGSPDDARLLEQAAMHMEAAGEPLRAAETYERAARARAQNARPERTLPLVLRALELIPLETRSAASVADSIRMLARAPLSATDYPRLSDMVRRLGSHLLARTDADPRAVRSALLDLVKVQRAICHFQEAQQLLLRILALCEQDQEHRSAVLLQLSDTQIALGEFGAASETLARFEALENMPSSAARHEAAVLRAHAHAQAGERERALALLAEAGKLTEPGDVQSTFRLAQVQALAHALFGNWQESSSAAQRAATAARSLGHSQKEATYRHYEGEALTHLGQYAKAYAAFRGSLALARDLGNERWINKNHMLLAFLEALEGSVSAAEQVRQCLAWAEERHETQDVAKGHLLYGLLLRHEGNEPAAQRELSLARQVAVAIGHRLLIFECDVALGQRSTAD